MQDGKYLILCIDDDQDILDSLQMILESSGYAVAMAHTGEEGLKAYKKAEPDLILLDLMMEEVDAGTRFVRELKLLGSSVPIFMLTSVGDQLNMSTSYADLGLTGVVQKPISPETLLMIVRAKLK